MCIRDSPYPACAGERNQSDHDKNCPNSKSNCHTPFSLGGISTGKCTYTFGISLLIPKSHVKLSCFHDRLSRGQQEAEKGTQLIFTARLLCYHFPMPRRPSRNKVALPIFAYIVMPNHWHFVVKPKNKNQVTDLRIK